MQPRLNKLAEMLVSSGAHKGTDVKAMNRDLVERRRQWRAICGLIATVILMEVVY